MTLPTNKLPAAVRAVLEGDSTLTTALTGGIWDADELPREGLPAVTTIWNGAALKPVMVLRWEGDQPRRELDKAGRRFLAVWVYQDTGRSTIETVLRRVRALLHQKYFNTNENSAAVGRWVGDLGEFTADELGGAQGDRARFEFTYAGR